MLGWKLIHVSKMGPRLCFYQTRSAWSRDQGSHKNHSHAYNFTPTVTKFCVMWEGLSLPHDTKFGNCRCKIVDSRVFPIWSLIHGSSWSGLIKAGPGWRHLLQRRKNTHGFGKDTWNIGLLDHITWVKTCSSARHLLKHLWNYEYSVMIMRIYYAYVADMR